MNTNTPVSEAVSNITVGQVQEAANSILLGIAMGTAIAIIIFAVIVYFVNRSLNKKD